MAPDLSDLTPFKEQAGPYHLLGWPALLRDEFRTAGLESGAAVQVLGYMFEGNQPLQERQWIGEFVLLPEPGNLLHPAHRFGDQMIAVHLLTPARFLPRGLVWAWGTLRPLKANARGPEPLYAIEQAQTRPASESEIGKHYR